MSVTFYRDKLRKGQAQAFYDAICSSISRGNLSGSYQLSVTDRRNASRDAFDAIEALRLDRPEFFFISGQRRTSLQGDRLTLTHQVDYTLQQIRQIRSQLDRVLSQVTAGTGMLHEWERERVVYERLCRRLTYAEPRKDGSFQDSDYNIVGPVLRGIGVCAGFSDLLVLALRAARIPCIRVGGYGRRSRHSWNMAWIEGSPVHLDLTWEHIENGKLGYYYFNLTDEQIERDHVIRTKGLPRCTDPTLGYHFRSRQLFSTVHGASRFLKQAFRSGDGPYTVRFSGWGDPEDKLKKAMSNAPVQHYRYRFNTKQQAVMVWRA